MAVGTAQLSRPKIHTNKSYEFRSFYLSVAGLLFSAQRSYLTILGVSSSRFFPFPVNGYFSLHPPVLNQEGVRPGIKNFEGNLAGSRRDGFDLCRVAPLQGKGNARGDGSPRRSSRRQRRTDEATPLWHATQDELRSQSTSSPCVVPWLCPQTSTRRDERTPTSSRDRNALIHGGSFSVPPKPFVTKLPYRVPVGVCGHLGCAPWRKW